MKRALCVLCGVIFSLVFVTAVFADDKISYKKGEEVYVCGCGAACPCGTISKKPGKCSCGKDLVKTTIDKVAGGKAYVTVDGKTLVLKASGKYVCSCGAGCDCGTISQEPGQCACGAALKAVTGAK